MKKYIFTDNALAYMLETFPKKTLPTLYENFCEKFCSGEIICERETKHSLEYILEDTESLEWVNSIKSNFQPISQKESKILGDMIEDNIFSIVSEATKYQRNIPVAIPFVFAVAVHEKRTIVVDKKSPDYDVIVSISQKLGCKYLNMDDFLSQIS